MYLDKINAYITEYPEKLNAIKEDYENTIKKLAIDYGTDGNFYIEKQGQAEKLYKAQTEELRQNGFNLVKETFDNLDNMINDFIIRPVPEDFENTLKAIEIVGKLTEAEAQRYMDKYQTNYLASRALYETLKMQGFNLTKIKVNNVESIKEELKEARMLANNFFKYNNPNSYSSKLLVHEKSPLKKYDAALEKFLNVTVYSAEL